MSYFLTKIKPKVPLGSDFAPTIIRLPLMTISDASLSKTIVYAASLYSTVLRLDMINKRI